jgi:hypothetical protein
MKIVCKFLHEGLTFRVGPNIDTAGVIMEMALVADTYGVVGILKNKTSPALFDSLLAHQQPRSMGPVNRVENEEASVQASPTDAMLAVSAYLLEQEEMFTLYTKRLVMGHCVQFLDLSVLCKVDYFKTIPAFALRQCPSSTCFCAFG